jgi:type IV secretion system protein VirB1
MDALTLSLLLATCAPQVHPETAAALIAVESARNPYAIGVVGGALLRQPVHRQEAIATARALEAGGWDFSVGLGQINRRNFVRLGLTLNSAFDPCTNLTAMQTVLGECFDRAGPTARGASARLRDALSCYYSGNFSTGHRHGYVRKVVLASLTTSSVVQRKERS